MSREIKFRAWNGKKFIEDYYNHGHFVSINDGKLIQVQYDDVCPEGVVYGKPEQMELQQYTGLKDKNGVDVYENDIVEQHHFTDKSGKAVTILHTVVWSDRYNGWACLNCKSNDESDGSPQLWVYSKTPFAVVGNIYQNQDLLK